MMNKPHSLKCCSSETHEVSSTSVIFLSKSTTRGSIGEKKIFFFSKPERKEGK